MLIQSVYTSAAIQPMPKSKLYKILWDSRVRNKLADVTGLLVYVDGKFLQVLEGEDAVVSTLLEKISKDLRHNDVKVVYKAVIEKRTFNAWQMAYVSPSPKELATWAGLSNTTTLETTLKALESEPSRFPSVLSKLWLAIPAKDLEPE